MDISKAVEQLTPVFNSLSEKIGQGGTWMFEIYVRQQYVLAVQAIVIGITSLVIAIFLYKVYKNSNSELAFFTCVGCIVLTMLGIFMLCIATGHLINPQYGALQDLIGTFIPQPNGN